MTHEDPELIDCYVAAASRGVQEWERERLLREFREDIAARVAELTGQGTGVDGAVRQVLATLGDPALITARRAGPISTSSDRHTPGSTGECSPCSCRSWSPPWAGSCWSCRGCPGLTQSTW